MQLPVGSTRDMNPDNFRNKRIFITGGTGSFGQALVPVLLNLPVKSITVYSRGEEKQLNMSRLYPDPRLQFIIGDVRDRERIFQVTRDVDILYHAAALKIISVCEKFPEEAFRTNVVGTMNVKDACLHNSVSKALFINTDKAVKPINAYGMTKGLAEKIWLKDNLYTATRYGNVFGSRGSVVPYFAQLISQKQPLKITDSRMTRFILTLEQAVGLVLFATENMSGGDVFIYRCPACRIMDLAEAMAGKDYPVEFTGIQPGEKLHELLYSKEESLTHGITTFKNNFAVISPSNGSELEDYSSDKAEFLSVPKLRRMVEIWAES